MKFRLVLTLSALFIKYLVFAQAVPVKVWDKTFGGDDFDGLREIQQTSDGGFIVCGESNSGQNGDKSQSFVGGNKNFDIWIVKVDSLGNKIWDKVIGGTGGDGAKSIVEVTGGYIIAGGSASPISGDKTHALKGFSDIWLIKLDLNGNKLWDKVFGGFGNEGASVIKQTTDGGFIIGGNSNSGIGGDKSQASRGNGDYWIVKLDVNGDKIWDKTFGGNKNDNLVSIQQTADGGYFLGGHSDSDLSGDKVGANKGDFDFWVIKLNAVGNKQWDKTIGTSGLEYLFSAFQTSSGNYLLGGWSSSGIEGDKSQVSKGGRDYWIVSLDNNGNKVWDKTIGGSGDELFNDMKEVNNGFLLVGKSNSNMSSDKSENIIGNYDFWVVKTDFNGNKIWDKTIGSYGDDDLTKIQVTIDGGCILGGFTDTGIGADKSQPSKGWMDYWIVKIKGNISIPTGLENEIEVKNSLFQNHPNPFNERTLIPFKLTYPGPVEIVIYNSLSQRIGSISKEFEPGNNSIDLSDIIASKNLKSGTYYYQIKTVNFTQSKRMIKL